MTRRPIDEAAAALGRVDGRDAALAELAACCRDFLDALAEDPRGEDRNVDLRAGILAASIEILYAKNAKL